MIICPLLRLLAAETWQQHGGRQQKAWEHSTQSKRVCMENTAQTRTVQQLVLPALSSLLTLACGGSASAPGPSLVLLSEAWSGGGVRLAGGGVHHCCQR
jgi:hypothetical protein